MPSRVWKQRSRLSLPRYVVPDAKGNSFQFQRSRLTFDKDAAGRDGTTCPDRRVVRNIYVSECEGRHVGLPGSTRFSSALIIPMPESTWEPQSPRPNSVRQTPWKELAFEPHGSLPRGLPPPRVWLQHSRQRGRGRRLLLAGLQDNPGQPRSPRAKERLFPCPVTPHRGAGPRQRPQTLNPGKPPTRAFLEQSGAQFIYEALPSGRQPPGTPRTARYENVSNKTFKEEESAKSFQR